MDQSKPLLEAIVDDDAPSRTALGRLRVDHESLARMEVRLSLRPRVLLADDYPDMVKAVSRLLALDCEIVGSVADGGALLEAAQRLQPDVIVLDVNLPNVHSLEAARESAGKTADLAQR